jgi:hypothetical protein
MTEFDNHSLSQSRKIPANKVKGCEEATDSDKGRAWGGMSIGAEGGRGANVD